MLASLCSSEASIQLRRAVVIAKCQRGGMVHGRGTSTVEGLLRCQVGGEVFVLCILGS